MGTARAWTDEEVQYLIRCYDKQSTDDIAKRLNRTRISINKKARTLNLSKKREWSEQQTTFLIEHYGKIPNGKLAKILGKPSADSVQRKATSLNLTIPKVKKNKEWTIEEEEKLLRLYETKSAHALAKEMGRSYNSVTRKAQKLHINAYVGERLLVKQMAQAFNCDSRVINRWIDKFELPAREFTRGKGGTSRAIDVKTFWKWAETHKDLIPLQKYESLSLCPEPSWLQDAIKTAPKRDGKDITIHDVQTVRLGKKQNKSYAEIARELGRTRNSVIHIWKSIQGKE